MRVRIKICGITSVEDAQAAVQAGADALGFMFYAKSPRNLSLAKAAKIIRTLPPYIAKVGVFVDPPAEFVRAAVEHCGLDTLQFHGNETPQFCNSFAPLTVYKAFRVKDAAAIDATAAYRKQAWLLDSYVAGQPGGTGEVFNWDFARQVVDRGACVILAGGLTSKNVAKAVRKVRPYAVDVSSGVELSPGKKDAAKVRSFIKNALRASLASYAREVD